MTIADWIIFSGLIIGPVAAVYIGKLQEERKAQKNRKWRILRNLMQFRGVPLSPERVGALNLIEIEFHDDKEILEAWNKVRDFFGTAEPEGEVAQKEFFKERDREQMRLIELIALKLKVKLDRDDISKNAYAPVGWADFEHQQETIRHLLIEVLRGETSIQVVTHSPHEQKQTNDGEIKAFEPPTHKT